MVIVGSCKTGKKFVESSDYHLLTVGIRIQCIVVTQFILGQRGRVQCNFFVSWSLSGVERLNKCR